MDSLDTLKRAYKLIENEENWLVGRLKDGNRFCAVGALIEVDIGSNMAHQILTSVTRRNYNMRIHEVNNFKGHEAILECFRDAIALEEEKLYGTPISIQVEKTEQPNQTVLVS